MEEQAVNQEEAQESIQEAQVEQPQETPPARKESDEEKRKRNDAEYNWAETRRKMQEMDRQIRERDEYISKLKAAPAPAEEEISLGEDDLPTYGQVKKSWKKDKERLVEEIRKEMRAEMAQSTLKLRLPDYDDVVTQDNIERLKELEPEIAASLAESQDPYKQAVAVYKALKMMGVEVAKAPSVEREKAIKNTQKPVSVNAVTKQSAIGNAHLFENGLTPELKKSLYEEMQRAKKLA